MANRFLVLLDVIISCLHETCDQQAIEIGKRIDEMFIRCTCMIIIIIIIIMMMMMIIALDDVNDNILMMMLIVVRNSITFNYQLLPYSWVESVSTDKDLIDSMIIITLSRFVAALQEVLSNRVISIKQKDNSSSSTTTV